MAVHGAGLLTHSSYTTSRDTTAGLRRHDVTIANPQSYELQDQGTRARSGLLESSFPRKRESIPTLHRPWTPAFAGVTGECYSSGICFNRPSRSTAVAGSAVAVARLRVDGGRRVGLAVAGRAVRPRRRGAVAIPVLGLLRRPVGRLRVIRDVGRIRPLTGVRLLIAAAVRLLVRLLIG